MFGSFILSIPLFIEILHYYLLREPNDNPENKIKDHEGEEEQVDIDLWSELNVNLLGEILSRLCLTDRARFRVVCKNWLASQPINSTINESLSWCLKFDCSLTPVTRQFKFQLYDPYSPKPVSVHNIALTKFGIPCSSNMNITAILKHNWLLICTSKPRLLFWTRRYFLLFSPFSRKIITLPKFDYPRRFEFIVTFSTQLDSPDCVFFLVDTRHDKIVLLTYRYGDKEWTAKQIDRVTNFVPCSCNLVYLGGMLYIVSPYGPLASYNVIDGEFKFESLVRDRHLARNIQSRRRLRVFELNGELMILYFDLHPQQNITLPGKWCIRKYDWSNKVWIPVRTLGDKALFVNDDNFMIATTNMGVLPNNIYPSFASSNFLENGGGTTLSDTKKVFYWLEPPCDSNR